MPGPKTATIICWNAPRKALWCLLKTRSAASRNACRHSSLSPAGWWRRSPWHQYPGHVVLHVGDATPVLFERQQTLLLELVYGVLEVLPLLRREVLNVDIHDVRDLRYLDLFGCGPTGRAKKCVDAKCAPGAKHTTSRTKLASHTQRITRRASQFFLKINKR
jgi:hypothetical protein